MQTRSVAQEARYDRFGSTNPGNEPPLSLDGGRAPDRRRVSIRWLTGTILTGLFGATLMGGAVYAALDGEYTFARAPLAAAVDPRETAGDSQSNITSKSDRILTQSDEISTHVVIRVSTVTRVGDKDVVKVKPFSRIIANLLLTRGDLSGQVPPFNPLSIFNDANPDTMASEAAPAEDDGEVSLTTRNLAAIQIDSQAGPTVPIERVRALVEAELPYESNAVNITIPTQITNLGEVSEVPGSGISFAETDEDTETSIKKIWMENVTDVSKTAPVASFDAHEKTIVVQENETLATILGKLGATADDTRSIAQALGRAASLNEGQRLRVLVDPSPDDADHGRPVRISVFNADQHQGTVALSDNGEYVGVADPDATEIANASQDDEDDSSPGGLKLYDSIYETALKQKLPDEMVKSLLRIYAYDVDLNKRARPGDNFEIFYEQNENGEPQGDILYTSLSVDGELKRYYRFGSADDGQVDYYDEQGRSARKFLMRKPINSGEMRSTFGMRRHPILGYYKMHTGVDWAGVPVGTPILATGNGLIVKCGWTNGYGKHIEIQHANGYLTTYSHLSNFAKTMTVGAKVKLGQVIGYLGSTGLSTGPHIHYEVKINGSFVDPMRIKLPQGRELNGDLLATFRQERDRLDGMMNRAPVAENSVASKGT